MTQHSYPHSLTSHAVGMIVLLTLQYLLGEFTAAYIHLPQGKHSWQMWNSIFAKLPLALHAVVGFLLFVGTIALIVRSIMAHDKTWIIASGVAGISVVAAVVAGLIFIPSKSETFSFYMALFFLVALFSYFWGLYQTK